jgi:hypothetical protein
MRVSTEQATEHGRLEMLGRQVAEAQDAHVKRVDEANAQLEAKEKKAQEEADAKIAVKR